ncbi:MAG TPA: riboflavin biosynthesis protein RibF [Chitinivibrionales bacterium]|nr:riboflavin biosynthesis protein RibF [Chitinivibrionales bacterium]
MKLIPYQKLPKSIKASVVTVGNFDGVHRGHAALISEVVKRAKEKGLASVIVTFDPHTRTVVSPESAQPVLSTLEEKAFLIGKLGADYLAWIPFNREFAETSSSDFVEKVIVGKLRAREWVMGEQHTFGKKQAGNKNFLQSGTGRNHIYVLPVAPLKLRETVVSSTEIRRKLLEGGVEEAVAMLGHPYLVSAARISGMQQGTKLGFPTLNFSRPSADKVLPPPGVYAAVLEHGARKWQGAFYFGNCPTFSNRDFHLEFHEFDFTGEVPGEGETAHLWLHGLVRKDMQFAKQDKLVAQMKKDVDAIKNFFAGEGICR